MDIACGKKGDEPLGIGRRKQVGQDRNNKARDKKTSCNEQDSEMAINKMKNGLNIASWVRQIIGEVNKVSWPSRQETAMATLMVVVFSSVMAIFLLLSDQVISRLVKLVLGW